jgi:hypothetical protein
MEILLLFIKKDNLNIYILIKASSSCAREKLQSAVGRGMTMGWTNKRGSERGTGERKEGDKGTEV